MKVKDLVNDLELEVIAGEQGLENEIMCGYCCDLLSRVMAKGSNGGAWITVQTHMNVIAVASLLDMACIIIPENIEVNKEVLDKANGENLPILRSALTAYELSGHMYSRGIK